MDAEKRNTTGGTYTNRNKFLRLEYAKALDIVHRLHDVRMIYQKFYIALVASVITLSVVILQFPPEPSTETSKILTDLLNVHNLLGIFFLLSGSIGVVVVRNLASIRCNEVFYNNTVIYVRKLLLNSTDMGGSYPELNYAQAMDRRSADYQTICVCSGINFVLFFVGILFVFMELKGLQVAIVVVGTLMFYSAVHFILVERPMKKPIPKFPSIGAREE